MGRVPRGGGICCRVEWLRSVLGLPDSRRSFGGIWTKGAAPSILQPVCSQPRGWQLPHSRGRRTLKFPLSAWLGPEGCWCEASRACPACGESHPTSGPGSGGRGPSVKAIVTWILVAETPSNAGVPSQLHQPPSSTSWVWEAARARVCSRSGQGRVPVSKAGGPVPVSSNGCLLGSKAVGMYT